MSFEDDYEKIEDFIMEKIKEYNNNDQRHNHTLLVTVNGNKYCVILYFGFHGWNWEVYGIEEEIEI